MPLHSAGLLPYRFRDEQLELFLAHPGGPFWAQKDDGVWTTRVTIGKQIGSVN